MNPTTGALGADSSQPISKSLIQIARQRFGAVPTYWGRYFTSPTTGGSVEYHHATESPIFAANGISVLPIARQTNDVGGSVADGARDGANNVADVVDSFGAAYLSGLKQDFYLVLDVEGAPNLSPSYYAGWSGAVIQCSQTVLRSNQLLPCLYASAGFQATWDALATATNGGGAHCFGLWVAAYPNLNDNEIPPWSSLKTPASSNGPLPPVLLWQFQGDFQKAIDCSQLNPALPLSQFLSHLVPPPATAS